MAKAKVDESLDLTPEEVQAIKDIRAAKDAPAGEPKLAVSELANALITAINATKPPEKKTSFNRIKQGPFDPKPGQVKPKLRRVVHQHGIELHENMLLAEEIELLNKVKPGSYCNGFVRVIKRKDRSLDIDYPIKTASQRLKLVNSFGIRSLSELCQRLISEAADPNKFRGPDEDEDE